MDTWLVMEKGKSFIFHVSGRTSERWYVNSRDAVPIENSSEIDEYETQMQVCNWKTLADFINCSFGI